MRRYEKDLEEASCNVDGGNQAAVAVKQAGCSIIDGGNQGNQTAIKDGNQEEWMAIEPRM